MNRRNFIKNTTGILVAAPMVVKADNIMKAFDLDKRYEAFLNREFQVIKYEALLGYEKYGGCIYQRGDQIDICGHRANVQHAKPGRIWVSHV